MSDYQNVKISYILPLMKRREYLLWFSQVETTGEGQRKSERVIIVF